MQILQQMHGLECKIHIILVYEANYFSVYAWPSFRCTIDSI